MGESPGNSETNGTGEAPISEKRLIITEMLLENFKSYAGIQRVGPFHKVSISVLAPFMTRSSRCLHMKYSVI